MIKKTVILGTKNQDKLKEMRRLFRGTGFSIRSLADFPDCQEAVESGRTFEANARIKSRLYSRHTRGLVLSDDSGLMVASLKGKPGVNSARFAGENCTYRDNNQKLLRLMKNKTSARSRRAKFVSVMALYENGKPLAVVRGECPGHIAQESRGSNGFGYDPVFIPEGDHRTFGEFSPKEKNKISHRSKSLTLAKAEILRLKL